MKENMKSPLFIKAKCAIYSLTITESQRIQMEQFLSEMEQKQKKVPIQSFRSYWNSAS